MADRRFEKGIMFLPNDLVCLTGYFQVNASGVVSNQDFKGVTSVAKSATGRYTVVLEDRYSQFLGMDITAYKNTAVGVDGQVGTADVDASTYYTSNPTIEIIFTDTASKALANPASCRIFCKIWLKNTSATVD